MKKGGITAYFSINSPVILGLTFLSLIILLGNYITKGFLNSILAIRYTSFLDPFMYLRLFTHVIAHQDLAHFTGNFLLILAVGPMVEEKYGSRTLLIMICITAVITGLVNILFFRNIMLIGASGLVFMLILLASFTNISVRKIPITVLLVGILYIGNEIISGIAADDNISQISHIIGGLCGGAFGFFIHKDKFNLYKK